MSDLPTKHAEVQSFELAAKEDVPAIPIGTPGTWTDLSNNSGGGSGKGPVRSDTPVKRSGYPR